MNKEGFKQAKELTKRHAKTFYFASHLLPKAERNASYAIYAICRISDDLVDIENKKDVNDLRVSISSAYSNKKMDDPILRAFQETVNKYRIPKQYFDELLNGMEMDLNISRYPTFNDLYEYCYRVAGVVGLIMLHLLGSPGKEAIEHAIELGIAMQLTNILRDINEDLARGRIYLPKDDLIKFNMTYDKIINKQISPEYIKFEIARARTYYNNAEKGIPLLKSVRSRLVVLLMKEMYEAILNETERMDYKVFGKRASVSFIKKLCIAMKVLFGFKYLRSNKIGNNT